MDKKNSKSMKDDVPEGQVDYNLSSLANPKDLSIV